MRKFLICWPLGWLRLLEALVTIITLGQYNPFWSIHVALWIAMRGYDG